MRGTAAPIGDRVALRAGRPSAYGGHVVGKSGDDQPARNHCTTDQSNAADEHRPARHAVALNFKRHFISSRWVIFAHLTTAQPRPLRRADPLFFDGASVRPAFDCEAEGICHGMIYMLRS